MKFERNAKIVLCIGFALLLVIPLIFTNFKSGTVSKIENRILNSFPQLYTENGEQNKEFLSEFESWFNDHVGFREEMFTLNSRIQYDLFQSTDSDMVFIGKDGWLFYTGGSNILIAGGEYPSFDESVLADICQKQQRIQEQLAEEGIEYVILLPPSKVSIYPEYLRGNFEVCRTPADILADYLEEHSDLKVVRLKQALLEEKAKSDTLLYYKTDTHWNAYGSYIGYCEIIRQLNEWGIINDKPVEVDYIEMSMLRDLMAMIAENSERYYEESAVSVNIHNAKSSKIEEGETYEKIQAYVTDKDLRRADYYLNSEASGPSFLVVGDSMFMDCALSQLLAENCSELAGVWTYDLTQELLDIAQPDVVFFEMTERSLNAMGLISHEFCQYSIQSCPDAGCMDIYYYDYGSYSQMWFPTWSEENGQDDLRWYEAKRLDDSTWYVRVDLTNHGSTGTYHVHFYQGTSAEDRVCTYTDTFYVQDSWHSEAVSLEDRTTEEDTIKNNLESFTIADGMVSVIGWGFQPGLNSETQTVYLNINGTTYTTRRQSRQDVANAYENDMYVESGFHALIPVDSIPEGELDLQVLIENSGGLYSGNPIKIQNDWN